MSASAAEPDAPGGAPPLSREDVAHVARLARLVLSDDELDRFTAQLAAVLDHASDLASLDLVDVAPMTHPYPLRNVMRDDVPTPSLDSTEVLAAAPFAEVGMFRVPPVLGESP